MALLCAVAVLCAVALSAAGTVEAATYPLQSSTNQLVGEVLTVEARAEETLMDIARANSVGFSGIRRANPNTDIWLPYETPQVVIPSQFLLPDAPREGIVLNLPELRLYYFHPDPASGTPLVTTYPVGIGRSDRQTPTGTGQVVMKLHKPAWYPTEEVLADYAARGLELPRTVPPGPDNPLGEYALVLDLPGLLIHGTNRPDGIGMLVSQGCIRLYPEHIKALVAQVDKGTPVTIVNQPYKVGIVDGELVVEIHPIIYPTEESNAREEQRLIEQIVKVVETRGDELTGKVDWDIVTALFQRADGLPTVVTGADVDHSPHRHATR